MQSITNLRKLHFVENVRNDMDSKTKNDTTLKLLSVGFYFLLASFISFDTAVFERFFFIRIFFMLVLV